MIGRVGVCSWSLQPESTRQLEDQLKACDIQCVQLSLCPFIGNASDLRELQRFVGDQDWTLCSGMMDTVGEDYASLERIKVTGGVRPDEHWDANLARAERCAEIAHQLGLKLVTLHAGFIPEDDKGLHDRMADRICRIAEAFERYEIQLGLETGQERAETLVELLSTIRSRARVGVNFDPANMILYAMGDPIQSTRLLSEHIVQVHMKDAIETTTPGTWGEEVVAGRGQVEWDAFFDIVESLPQSVDVIIEREAGNQRTEDVRAALELANRQIERVRS